MRVLNKVKPVALAAALTAVVTTASAQSDWSYEATIYLFMPETETKLDTPLGTLDGTLSFSDALENLDFAFMGALAATNGRWSVLADYNYTNLSFSNTAPGPAGSELESSVKTQFATAVLGYRIREDQSVSVDLAAGFRWYSTDTDFTLTSGALPPRTAGADDSWVDPIVGVHPFGQLDQQHLCGLRRVSQWQPDMVGPGNGGLYPQ